MDPRERDAMARLVLQVEELGRANEWLLSKLDRAERELRWARSQLSRVHRMTEKPWTPGVKYASEEERVEARRRSWRESKQRRKGLANGR